MTKYRTVHRRRGGIDCAGRSGHHHLAQRQANSIRWQFRHRLHRQIGVDAAEHQAVDIGSEATGCGIEPVQECHEAQPVEYDRVAQGVGL